MGVSIREAWPRLQRLCDNHDEVEILSGQATGSQVPQL